jgi:hypothetical protein
MRKANKQSLVIYRQPMLVHLLTGEVWKYFLSFRFSAIHYPFHKTEALNVRVSQET